jgi:hypothetical protein
VGRRAKEKKGKAMSTANFSKREEYDPLKQARDSITAAMNASKVSKILGIPLPKPLACHHVDAGDALQPGWYECPVCGYRTPWLWEACPLCDTLLEPE